MILWWCKATCRLPQIEKQDTNIFIIKKRLVMQGWRERLTPYQSKDTNPTTPTHRMKEERKAKQQETKSERAARPIKRHWPCSLHLRSYPDATE